MKKLTDKNNNMSYVFTEQERVSLASDMAKELLKSKLENINKYANTKIDFFTDRTVEEESEWHFNVEVNGAVYDCIYDSANDYRNEIEKELHLLMWRYNDDGGFWYCETIGNHIDKEGNSFPVEVTLYNDCEDVDTDNYVEIEEIEITDLNKDEIKAYLVA